MGGDDDDDDDDGVHVEFSFLGAGICPSNSLSEVQPQTMKRLKRSRALDLFL